MFAKPRPLTEVEIDDVVSRFAFVARVARESGFTGVQIHSAHGYLINQFLSPITNRRTDHYGGSLQNRARLLLEVVRHVRRATASDFPISVKLNSADFQKGGFSPDDYKQVVAWLVQEGIDLLEISGGTYEQPTMFDATGDKKTAADRPADSTLRREAYFLDYAARVRALCPVPLMVTGGFRTKAGMEAALASGDADVIGLARPLCVEPDLPARLIAGTCSHAMEVEGGLRLGPTTWLGPQSPITLIKAINLMGKSAWYNSQISAMAQGGDPDLTLGLFSALRANQAKDQAQAKAIRMPA